MYATLLIAAGIFLVATLPPFLFPVFAEMNRRSATTAGHNDGRPA